MMGWYGSGMGWVGWLGMGVFWLILLALIAWLVVRLLPVTEARTARSTRNPVLATIDRRPANDEIDIESWQTQRDAFLSGQRDRK